MRTTGWLAIELQKEEAAAAKVNFLKALSSLPGGGIQRKDIMSALDEAERQIAQLKQLEVFEQ